MPTILRQDGFEVMIYTQDHHPAHVHVWKAGGEAVFNLIGTGRAASLREVLGMRKKDVKEAQRIVNLHFQVLRHAWRRIHGTRRRDRI
jgi:thiazole synthase ThiGH ThiG subunit